MSAKIEMVVTDFTADMAKDIFDIEIEMLQGSMERLSDGRTKYVFNVPPVKAAQIKRFLFGVMFSENNTTLN